jgi:hypothetical protein
MWKGRSVEEHDEQLQDWTNRGGFSLQTRGCQTLRVVDKEAGRRVMSIEDSRSVRCAILLEMKDYYDGTVQTRECRSLLLLCLFIGCAGYTR